jgi:peptidoglycan hydrolase CwlO-like protein
MNIKKLKTIYSKLESIQNELQAIHEKAEETYNNRSDRWQESDAGNSEAERISYLDNAISDIASLLENLDNASFDENA